MTADDSEDRQSTFDDRVEAALETLPPAEQRMARFFVSQKQSVLLGSAAEVAALAGTSDATVVRTARSLGFESLAALRQMLLTDLTGTVSPGKRLAHTLQETGTDSASALHHVIGLHEGVLEVLKRPDMEATFARSVNILARANRRHIFGIGPSGAMAEYASLQFNRIGLPSSSLSVSGVALADRLLWLASGDAVLMMAYAPLYREVEIVLDQAALHDVPVVLISNNLGPLVSDKVAATLPVPRGKADHLATHGGTMVLIEAMIIALAAKAGETAFDSLDRLSTLRGAIDKAWVKRGIRKK
ncbi:MurR/RpiR family transcriptional regulator [Mesorhizobium sp. ESP6-5]|uniref:MurR/RpiR family transcriptional regulator n=1 Tax=Mesorhizobium sp. ESP6-5 TaxID=2876623 RepID=UPI001CCF5394|nr:MurR/RpiR family transcriptional regulator [Mesorhizobium sp. ESP6-5]MBZ9757309.1 MurR/RpiR family transcriptional regulator [Mesorhizobium sp. ESP6-5]